MVIAGLLILLIIIATISSLKIDLDNSMEEINTLNDEVVTVRGELSEYAKGYKLLNEEFEDLTIKYDKLKEKLATVEIERDELESKVNKLEKDKVKLKQDNNSLDKQLKQPSATRGGSRQKVNKNKVQLVDSNKQTVKKAATTSNKSLGSFQTTAYCACSKCCGPNAKGITATGTKVTAGRTIAVDPNVISLGSKVLINGKQYTAEDTGSAVKGKIIDIYMGSHSDALAWGRRSVDVQIIN